MDDCHVPHSIRCGATRQVRDRGRDRRIAKRGRLPGHSPNHARARYVDEEPMPEIARSPQLSRSLTRQGALTLSDCGWAVMLVFSGRIQLDLHARAVRDRDDSAPTNSAASRCSASASTPRTPAGVATRAGLPEPVPVHRCPWRHREAVRVWNERSGQADRGRSSSTRRVSCATRSQASSQRGTSALRCRDRAMAHSGSMCVDHPHRQRHVVPCEDRTRTTRLRIRIDRELMTRCERGCLAGDTIEIIDQTRLPAPALSFASRLWGGHRRDPNARVRGAPRSVVRRAGRGAGLDGHVHDREMAARRWTTSWRG